MNEETETLPILQLTEHDRSKIQAIVVRESSLTIFFNNQELVTMLCSPTNLEYLIVGFLFSEGLVKGKNDIKNITVDDQRGAVRVETQQEKELAREISFKRLIASSGGRGASFRSAPDARTRAKVESRIEISPHKVFALMDEFVQRSELYRTTGGVHSAALCDTTSILFFAEDIGRHNAIDKIFGQCLLEDISTDDRIILTSGRISSEILLKVAKRNIPIIISKSAPTNLGVRLANDLGITLIGFVRAKRMNGYTNDWRIVSDGG